MIIIGAQCAAHLSFHPPHTLEDRLTLNTAHLLKQTRVEQRREWGLEAAAIIMAGSDKLKLIPYVPPAHQPLHLTFS